MDWNRIGRQARRWLQAQQTELLSGSRTERDSAEQDAAAAQHEIGDEVVGSVEQRVMERVLPEPLAALVRDHQPDVVAAREAAAHRAELAGRPRASVTLTVTLTEGIGPAGHGQYEFAADVVTADADEAVHWARIELDADDPAAPPQFGGAPFAGLRVDLPSCPGPGRFSLAELGRTASAELCVQLGGEDTESYLYWPDDAEGHVELTESGLSFEADMASAGARARVIGVIGGLGSAQHPWWQPTD